MALSSHARSTPTVFRGSLKNLLDWLVGSVEFPGKQVASLNTSSMSVHAPAQLLEVLRTMNARITARA